MRYKINRCIAISQPRSIKHCAICHSTINNVGVIIYLNHETARLYDWVHIHCVQHLHPKHVHSSFLGAAKLEAITSKHHLCSYCDKNNVNKPIYVFLRFNLHPKCIEKLTKKIGSIMDKYGEKITAEIL